MICVAEVGFLPSVLLKTVYKCQTWRLLKGVILVILMDFSWNYPARSERRKVNILDFSLWHPVSAKLIIRFGTIWVSWAFFVCWYACFKMQKTRSEPEKKLKATNNKNKNLSVVCLVFPTLLTWSPLGKVKQTAVLATIQSERLPTKAAASMERLRIYPKYSEIPWAGSTEFKAITLRGLLTAVTHLFSNWPLYSCEFLNKILWAMNYQRAPFFPSATHVIPSVKTGGKLHPQWTVAV